MGDISAEPSMEDILSSIKRIIAEEGESATAASRAKRQPRPVPPRADPIDFGHEEILELSDPVRAIEDDRYEASEPAQTTAPAPIAATPASFPPVAPASAPIAPAASTSAVPADPLLSARTAEVSRGSLDALSRMVVKPEVAGSDTLESLVREMLRPMLRDWLDTNLPAMVETMVAREISRITGQPR